MAEYDVAIIGGGASGLALAALLGHNTNLRVIVFEGGARAGRKLAASGNGQGNISNAHISAENYYGGGKALAAQIISRYGEVWKELFYGKFVCDERGRIYPAGRQASALTDCLLLQLRRCGVQLLTGVRVVEISKRGEFVIRTEGGEMFSSAYVVLCTGGKAQKQFGTDGSSYALAEAFGHSITALHPSLVQIKTDTSYIKTLRGIRADCEVRAVVKEKTVKVSRGDVIFTEYGVSGNAIFSLTPAITDKQGAGIILSFAPEFTEKEIECDVRLKKSMGYERSELLSCTLNNQIGRAVIRRCRTDNESEIAGMVKNFTLEVKGTLGFDYAQVTKGGVDMREVKENLESSLVDNLFFAGEILDVDGDCGGYNLTWAFASAACVAEGIEKRQL